MTCLAIRDPITLVATTSDEYGAEVLDEQAHLLAAIDLNTGYSHGANQTAVTSDAIVYISPENEFVQDNFYRLEEMLVVIDLFNTPESRSWYKITSVNVARDTQLCNKIDHLELMLKKTSEVLDIS